MKRRMISLLASALLILSIAVPAASASAASGLTFPQRECTHPLIGFPTCYTQQADGMWAREELMDTDTAWLVVGVVTFDTVVASVGEINAIAP